MGKEPKNPNKKPRFKKKECKISPEWTGFISPWWDSGLGGYYPVLTSHNKEIFLFHSATPYSQTIMVDKAYDNGLGWYEETTYIEKENFCIRSPSVYFS